MIRAGQVWAIPPQNSGNLDRVMLCDQLIHKVANPLFGELDRRLGALICELVILDCRTVLIGNADILQRGEYTAFDKVQMINPATLS